MISFVQTTIDGLLIGATYGLIGLGFALIFGVMKRINLAYGSCLLFGAALAIWLQSFVGYGAFGLFCITLVGCGFASLYVERLCFRPHNGRNALITSMVASFAIWMQLDEISAKLLPHRTHGFKGIELESLEIGSIILRSDQIFQLLVSIAVLFGLYIIVKRTPFGLQIDAVAQDRNLATLIGVRTRLVETLVFILAGFVGGLGAFLVLSSDGQVTPLFGLWATFKGLVAVMIGGMGSLPGAVIGGLILGLLETHAAHSLGVEYRDIVMFGLLFLVLVLRPSGLMGSGSYNIAQLSKERF